MYFACLLENLQVMLCLREEIIKAALDASCCDLLAAFFQKKRKK